MRVTSPFLEGNKYIPKRFSPPQGNVKAPIFIEDIPPETKTLAVVFDGQGMGPEAGSERAASDAGRYVLKVYALDRVLGIYDKVAKTDLEASMGEHILGKAELIGSLKNGGWGDE